MPGLPAAGAAAEAEAAVAAEEATIGKAPRLTDGSASTKARAAGIAAAGPGAAMIAIATLAEGREMATAPKKDEVGHGRCRPSGHNTAVAVIIPLLRPAVSRVARGDRGRTDCAGERRLAAGRGCSRLWEQAGS